MDIFICQHIGEEYDEENVMTITRSEMMRHRQMVIINGEEGSSLTSSGLLHAEIWLKYSIVGPQAKSYRSHLGRAQVFPSLKKKYTS
jgi:hypothetical protein